jgi:O-antigen/teichoic acid export membrane protein
MAALAVSRVVVAVSGAVVLSVLYGRLGVHDFGVWIVLNGLVAVFTLLDLGFGSAIVRDVAASSGEPTDRVRSTAGLALLWSLAVVAVGMLLVSGPWSVAAALLDLGPGDGAVRAAVIVLMAATAFDIVLLPWRASLRVCSATSRWRGST